MNDQGIDSKTLATLNQIAAIPQITGTYYLAGGTACALHLGHRLSYDLDFFSLKPLEPHSLLNILKPLGNLEITQNDIGTFNGLLNETKISFFIYPYPSIEPAVLYHQTPIASIKDLACMKLESVSSRGVKRDFVDLYYIAKVYSLESMFEWFNQKYIHQNISLSHVMKSLVYFNDAEDNPEPMMHDSAYSWDQIKQYFIDSIPPIASKMGL